MKFLLNSSVTNAKGGIAHEKNIDQMKEEEAMIDKEIAQAELKR